MPLLLVLVFAGIVLLEIVVILQVGAAIGIGWTLVLMIATSFLGVWLLQVGGRRAFSEFRRALSEGRWPGDEVADGALIIVGGILLVTPGFVTDAVGLLALVRPLRRLLAGRMRSRYATSSRADGRGRAYGHPPLDVEVLEIEREPRPSPSDGSADPAGEHDR